MATYVKFQSFVEKLAEGVMNLGSDTLQVALSNAANPPSASLDADLADFTQIAYTNLSAQVITTISSSQTGGTYSLVLADLVLTASGAVAPFRYVTIFDQTAAGDPLIAFFDYGSEVTLGTGETFTVDFGSSLFTMT